MVGGAGNGGERHARTAPDAVPLGRGPADGAVARARAVAAAVPDPEIPAITLADLGVLRDVRRTDDGGIVVEITPTYTGCPATAAIRLAVEAALAEAGLTEARVATVLAPAWSTDDITDEGRRKLKAYGIAPPGRRGPRPALFGDETVACPRCESTDTVRISEFGSTACKALRRCRACGEPFDHFKCL